jgi:predicted transcriptional regulator
MVSISDSLSAISDDKSLVLFNTIALASGDSSILISRLNLTRKQYYSRMFDLINAGLVRRINGRYFVTSFGKVVYKAQELIGMAVQYSSKLKAIDSVESPKFPAAELSKIIDTLIGNSEIKEILVSRKHNNNIPAENEIDYNRELAVPATKRNSIHESTNIYAHTI